MTFSEDSYFNMSTLTQLFYNPFPYYQSMKDYGDGVCLQLQIQFYQPLTAELMIYEYASLEER